MPYPGGATFDFPGQGVGSMEILAHQEAPRRVPRLVPVTRTSPPSRTPHPLWRRVSTERGTRSAGPHLPHCRTVLFRTSRVSRVESSIKIEGGRSPQRRAVVSGSKKGSWARVTREAHQERHYDRVRPPLLARVGNLPSDEKKAVYPPVVLRFFQRKSNLRLDTRHEKRSEGHMAN